MIVSELSRLGREQLETGYAIKQLSQAGVRIVSYLEDREIVLESAVDVFQLAAVNFAAAVEQEKARQRAWDAALRRAKAGHVAGGRVFGYANVRLHGHVERQIVESEAAVVRRIFRVVRGGLRDEDDRAAVEYRRRAVTALTARTIAIVGGKLRPRSAAPGSLPRRHHLESNTETGPVGRAPSTATAGRRLDRRAGAILTDRVVGIVDRGACAVRDRATDPDACGWPTLWPSTARRPSKYLLTNPALRGRCGGPLRARSRKDAASRYGCSWYHERGTTVCANNADVPMAEADDSLLGALLDEVLDPSIVRDAVDEAVRLIVGDADSDPVSGIERLIAKVDQERARLVSAIAAGGELESLLVALREREKKLEGLRADVEARRAQKRPGRADVARIRSEVLTLARDWRQVLADDPDHARPIVTGMLVGRVTIAPTRNPKEWKMRGEGTLAGLFERTFPLGWRPRAELNCRPRA